MKKWDNVRQVIGSFIYVGLFGGMIGDLIIWRHSLNTPWWMFLMLAIGLVGALGFGIWSAVRLYKTIPDERYTITMDREEFFKLQALLEQKEDENEQDNRR